MGCAIFCALKLQQGPSPSHFGHTRSATSDKHRKGSRPCFLLLSSAERRSPGLICPDHALDQPSLPRLKDPALAFSSFDTLLQKIETRAARAGIIGLGYVGLPLAMAVARSGFAVTGFDIDPGKMVALDARRSYIDAVTDAALSAEIDAGRFKATTDFA